VAAPDKFRGTAAASEVAAVVARAGASLGWSCTEVPMADGGEGILDVLGGRVRRTSVQGPLGEPVTAEWRLDDRTAVVEMARASGLELAGGPRGNDPVAASTTGTGQLIAAAVAAGARRVIVGVGGSATTDGGLGALRALEPHPRLAHVELIVACDVTTTFVDAAEHFAPQKGASPAQVALLRRRLERLAQLYDNDYGVDVRHLPGSGAAGGLAGGLAALGASLVPGFDLVAEAVGLAEEIDRAELVVTGEGFLDEQSFRGKVVGEVAELSARANVPVLAVVGEVVDDLKELGGDSHQGHDSHHDLAVISLVERHGRERATGHPLECIEEEVTGFLQALQALRRM
jgi:glycerate kinase